MLLTAAQICQISAVTLKSRILCVETIQLFIADRHNFGRIKTAGCPQGNIHSHELAGHGLIGRLTGILIALTHTVIGQQFALTTHLLHSLQVGKKLFCRIGKVPGKRSQFLRILLQFRKGLFPCCVVYK